MVAQEQEWVGLEGGGLRRVEHDCGLSRSIGWFIEGVLPLALFCGGGGVLLTLRGITHDGLDLTVDALQAVTLPLLQNFGAWGLQLKVKRRRGCSQGRWGG